MCLNYINNYLPIDAHKQYEVFGIVYDRCNPHRTSHSALHGKTLRGNAVDFEIGETYSAQGGIIDTPLHQTYQAGFHRFMTLEDARKYLVWVDNNENTEAVIAKFTVSGEDAMAQGYVWEDLLVVVWRKVTYTGCVYVRTGTYCSLYTYMPIPNVESSSPQPMELVEAAKGPKDYAFADELAYLAIGEDI